MTIFAGMRGRMMAKIRYSELPAGLHVSATRHGRRTIIYLKPGLTPAERRAALVRVRSSGRMGHGPELPPLSMAVAVGSDRLRTTLRNGAAAMRSHPLLLLPPLVLLVSTAIVFVLMSFVTLTLHRHPSAATGQNPAPVSVQPTQHAGSRPGEPGSAGGHHGSGPGDPAGGQSSRSGHPGASPRPSGSGPQPTPPSISSPIPDPSGSTGPSPTPTPSTSGLPTPDPTPSPSPSPSSSGTCLQIGPLGLCVTL
jgi:hypothetical protein